MKATDQSTQLNRRAILAGAAAVAAPAPALALAHEPDPIFEAIAARKATEATAEAAMHAGEKDAVFLALGAADVDAIVDVLSTPPATLAGVKELLRYVIECEQRGDDILGTVEPDVFLYTLLTALERL